MRLRTGFSFRAAVGLVDECIARIGEIGWPVAPITDRASTFGWAKWEKAALAAGMRPIFGVELAVTPSIHAKKPVFDFWTFIATDDLSAVNRLVALATQQFRYRPLLTYDDAMKATGVLKIIGHRTDLAAIVPDESMFYGLGPASSRGHVRRAMGAGLRLVAVSDNVFPRAGDAGFYETVCGRDASTQTYDQFIQDDDQWRASVIDSCSESEVASALATRNELWSRTYPTIRRAALLSPDKPQTLRQMCESGAAKCGVDLTDPVYAERLERELYLIAEKRFEDYFYIVADICQWARRHMAVGPARGSSCGSLVCYLLDITTVDPIKHGLIFERFIDVNRADLPDIDIDFSDQKRHLLFDYVAEKYGHDRTARLGTVAMYKARSALQEAGAALKVPRWKCDAVLSALVERSSGDSRVNDTLEDALLASAPGKELLAEWPEIMVAARMEGHPRHYSQHAAGIVISAEPVANYVAVDHRTNATMCDKYDAEGRLGLLKIDALGLTQLSILEDALESVSLTMRDLQKVPLDDRAAFDVLNRGDFSGIFQWNGHALQSLTRQINVDRFDDIVAISALARPGPLATGGSTQWAKRRMGEAQATEQHPLLAAQTQETFGVVVYQETVMNICRQIGNFSWADTSAIRKLMSSRAGNEKFAKFEVQFLDGAEANGMQRETAKTIWDQINTFGSWAFNKSHAVAYGYISYWCCWMKAHHPFEFAAATLTHEKDPDKQIQLLRELRTEGYEYIPVDAKLSTDRWTVGRKDGRRYLIGPLQSVKGLGPALVNQIIGCRARNEPLPSRAAKLLADPKTDIDSLTPIADAIARCMPDPQARNIFTIPTPIARAAPSAKSYEVLFLCTITKINPRDENEEINVMKRGHRITDGPTESLQLRLRDDTGDILAKINRFKFARLAPDIINRGRPGKALYAFKGKLLTIGDDFTMMSVDAVRYIGDIDQK